MALYEQPAVMTLVEAAIGVFRRQKQFAEHCFQQLNDEQFFAEPYAGHNSVGVIAQHVGGNLLSRWTNFLTEDGEKPWRDREAEFARPGQDLEAHRSRVMDQWERGWATLFDALTSLRPEELHRTVRIRGVDHSIPLAILRQVDHYAHHVGQIATISRMHVGSDRWTWFTPTPGGTAAYNASLGFDPPAADRPGR